MNKWLSFPGLVLAAVILAVGLLLVPIPPILLDFLLVANVGVALLLLVLTARAGHPRRLPLFPALLIVAMLVRLGLNIAAVRLILTEGFAGYVIDAVGQWVVRGNYVVGVALLLMLAVVQYLVIARGGERMAEVAARFALDALPGQQAAIEADARAQVISPSQAQKRRAELHQEAQVYGAMDGALRFIKGDVVASLAILAIGLVAGLGVGVLQQQLSFSEALQRYALLTIGDGLVTQLPVLLSAIAAGLLLTRAAAAPAPLTVGPSVSGPAQLGLDDLQQLLDELPHPTLLRETVPRRVELTTLWQLCRRLLAEGVPLELRAILEALAALPKPDPNPVLLTEQVRDHLGWLLVRGRLDGAHLAALVIDAEIEDAVREAHRGEPGAGELLAIEPDLVEELEHAVAQGRAQRSQAVLLCHRDVRRHLHRLLPDGPPVLAFSELPEELSVSVVGRITPAGFLPAGEPGA